MVARSEVERGQLNHPILCVYWSLKKKRTSLASKATASALPDPTPVSPTNIF